MLLGALGVVFGDIGTSPIYALRESLKAGGGQTDVEAVLGVLSLVFWAVVIVVAIKYVMLVMRADNDGEGGTMALLSLALPVCGRARTVMLVIGLAGASLFFGDAMITPAISVLSAIEGLAIVTPRVTPYVVPIAVVVLVALFAIQRRGSGVVGKLFGPVMVAWFAMLAVAGIVHILDRPTVLVALDPRRAIHYLTHANGGGGLVVIGSVFLALTGGEALYADMGHFGRRAIRVDWFFVVMPALVLDYFGQGALVLVDGHAADNPFFHMFGGWTLLPAVLLGTMATVIASQAVISGAFALVQQAIQLGALPRLHVLQTSDEAEGQVYVSPVNWLLAVAVIGLVVGFRSSDALASAYGMAVSGNMLVTTLLVAIVAHRLWKWSLLIVLPVMGSFVLLDLTFVSANLHKIPSGGWFPLTVGAVLLTMMLCWRHGRTVALEKRGERAIALADFLALLDSDQAPTRVPGTAIYLTQSHDHVPRSARAQSQAQQRRSRVRRAAQGHDAARTTGAGERTRQGRAAGGRLSRRRDDVRLRREAGCARRIRGASRRARLRSSVVVLLPRPRDAGAFTAPRDSPLAGAHLRVPHAQRGSRARLLPDSARPGRGTGYPRRDVARKEIAPFNKEYPTGERIIPPICVLMNIARSKMNMMHCKCLLLHLFIR